VAYEKATWENNSLISLIPLLWSKNLRHLLN